MVDVSLYLEAYLASSSVQKRDLLRQLLGAMVREHDYPTNNDIATACASSGAFSGIATYGKWRDKLPTGSLLYLIAGTNDYRTRVRELLNAISSSYPLPSDTFTFIPGKNLSTKVENMNPPKICDAIVYALLTLAGTRTVSIAGLKEEVLEAFNKHCTDSGQDGAAATAVFELWAKINLEDMSLPSANYAASKPKPTLDAEQAAFANVLVTIVNGGTASSAMMHAAPSAPAPAAPAVKLDPGMASAINTLLTGATGGKLNDINNILDGLGKAGEVIKAKDKELNDLKTKMSLAATVAVTPIKIAATGVVPDGESEMINVSKVFTPTGMKADPMLNFESYRFNWKGDHPDVPAIDDDYEMRPDLIASLALAFNTNSRVYISGDTGSGKTTGAQQYCALMGLPFHRVNMDGDITRADLIGTMALVQEAGHTVTKFKEGVLPRVMQHPGVLCIDEIDRMKPDIGYVMAEYLEGNGGLRLLEDGGRIVQPHPMFRIVATANTVGQGDEKGVYQGARHQSMAVTNRFGTWVKVDYLPKEAEQRLLQRRYPNLDVKEAQALINFAHEVRTGFRQGAIMQVVSPRNLLSLAQKFTFFTSLIGKKGAMEKALHEAVLNGSSDADAKVIREYAVRTLSAVR
jgi:cobaltochelatase CobS